MNAEVITHPQVWAAEVIAEVIAEVRGTTINDIAALTVLETEIAATRQSLREARTRYERALHEAVLDGLERLAAPIRPLAA